MREPMSPGRRQSIGQHAESAVNRTDLEALLKVCAEDVPALLEELTDTDQLGTELADARVLLADMVALREYGQGAPGLRTTWPQIETRARQWLSRDENGGEQ